MPGRSASAAASKKWRPLTATVVHTSDRYIANLPSNWDLATASITPVLTFTDSAAENSVMTQKLISGFSSVLLDMAARATALRGSLTSDEIISEVSRYTVKDAHHAYAE